MYTNSISSTGYNVQGSIVNDASTPTMSPDDIMNYVRSQLISIDGQMSDYKNMVVERQKKSEELREALSLMREMKNGDGEMRAFDETKYNRMMTLLAKNQDNPSAKAAYDALMDSYGGYLATEPVALPGGQTAVAGEKVGTRAGESIGDSQDMYLNSSETQSVLENAKQALESINSDNEMVMMELQKLMQQRSQVTQFASNAMNVDNETKKGVVANIR